MANINSVTLSGNLTRDPEYRDFNDGGGVCKLGIAVNGRKKDGDEWVDVPNFFNVSVFGKPGEWCRDQLHKGSPIVVHGRLQWSEWEAGGEKRSAVDVVAHDVVLPPRDSSPKVESSDDIGF